MPVIKIVTEKDLRTVARLDREAIEIVREAFVALASGRVVMPPILRLDVHEFNGEIDVKTAYVPGLDSFAIKMSPGFFDNPAKGLPTTNGLMVLFSAETGMVKALLLDNGYLTDVRTAAAGGLAGQLLAKERVGTVGVMGAGVQARLQVEALKLTRNFERLRVWARDPDKAAAFCIALEGRIGLPVEVAPSREALVRESDVVITSTPSHDPLIESAWLHPGLHITAMGADAEHKNELAPAVVADCDLFVCDTRAQSARLGELHHAIETGKVKADHEVAELGAVASGAHPGRTSDEQVTVCDLTGTGAQDTAIARFAYARAITEGLGNDIET